MEVETIPAPSDEERRAPPTLPPSSDGAASHNSIDAHSSITAEGKADSDADDEPPDSAPIASRGARMPRPKQANRRSKMVTLTLLDGTQITLPASPKASAGAPSLPPTGLTARDLIEALRAQAAGSDASEVLGDGVNWERMFAALLSVLLKKNLIHDWEFVREFER